MSCLFPLCDATEDSHAPFFHPLLVLCSTSRPAKADVPQRATLFQNDGLLFETPCCASKWLGWSAPVIPDSVLFANPVCEQAGLPQFSGFSILARFSFFFSLFINFWRVLKKRLLVLAHLPVVGAQSQIFVKIIIVVFSFFPSFSSTNSVVAHQSHPCPSLLLSHEH